MENDMIRENAGEKSNIYGLPSAFPNQIERTVPVVFAANEAFAPPCAVAIYSIFANAALERYYDIVVLESDIRDETKRLLCSLTGGQKRFSIRFFNAASVVQSYDLKANEHITVETFYRLLIQNLLPDYDKVLYLDGDLVCLRDVAELYDEDVGDCLLAAVRDADMLGNLELLPKRGEYLRGELKMENPYDYFQAGVLLLNLRQMRKAYSVEQWLTFATHRYMYSDQDVLNRYCQGRVKYLDMAWNVLVDQDHYRVPVIIAAAPQPVRDAYMASRKEPYIIHYAGGKKPWKRPEGDYWNYFWMYARKTPYYEKMLLDVVRQMQKDASFPVRFKRALKNLQDRVIPKNSSLRRVIQKIIGREEI